jgi:hypothetical protein
MREVTLFSGLLVLGLFGSQWLPLAFGEAYPTVSRALLLLTMITLAFIMIHVGYEFELEKSNLRQYGRDYLVAFTAGIRKDPRAPLSRKSARSFQPFSWCSSD